MMWDEIALELARVEREAFDAVRHRIAARQLGEAWVGLFAKPETVVVHSEDQIAVV